MRVITGIGILLGLCFGIGAYASEEIKPMAKMSEVTGVVPNFSPSPSPSPSPSVVAPLLPDEAKMLWKQFKRAQDAEMKGLEHRQKLELQELKASQSARQKDWDLKEKEARHKFFGENRDGPSRRVFVKDFLERRKSMHSLLTQELHNRENDQKVRRESLRVEQAEKKTQFEKLIASSVRPPADLWPAPGR